MNKTAEEIRRIAIIQALYTLIGYIHNDNKEAGWWTELKTGLSLTINYEENFKNKEFSLIERMVISEKINLIHGEISEAVEAHRKMLFDDKIKDRPGLEVELIDALVRIVDLLGALHMHDAPLTLYRKLELNRVRDDHKPENRKKTGGKLF